MPNRVLICGMPGSGTRVTVQLLKTYGLSVGGLSRHDEPRNMHTALSNHMKSAFKGMGKRVEGQQDGPFSKVALHYLRIRESLSPEEHETLSKIAQSGLKTLFTGRDVVKHPLFSVILSLLDLTDYHVVVQVRDAKRFLRRINGSRNPAMWYVLLNGAFNELKTQKVPYFILRYEYLHCERVQNALSNFAGVGAQFNEWVVKYPPTGRFVNQELPLPRGPQEFRGIRVLSEDIRELQHTLGY